MSVFVNYSKRPIAPRTVRQVVEHPAGSGIFPFSCPQWTARTLPKATILMDPSVYVGFNFSHAMNAYCVRSPQDYTGGTTAVDRAKWFDSTAADFSAYEKAYLQDDPFCKCNSPFTGTPPNCVFTCGRGYFKTQEDCSPLNSKDCCKKCQTGTTCDNVNTVVESIQLQQNYWRVSNQSLNFKPCTANR